MTATAGPAAPARVLGVRYDHLLAVAAPASILLKWTASGVGIIDVVLAVALFALGRSRPDRVTSLARRAMPALWLWALGSVIALRSIGFAGWAIVTLLTDAFLIAAFFAVYRIASRLNDRQWHTVLVALAVAITAVVVSVVVLGRGYRPSGTFDNPNYTAHWAGIAALLALRTWPALLARVAAVGAAALVMIKTGSFGGMALLAVGLCFAAYVHARRPSTHPYWRLVTVVLAVGSLLTFEQAFERFEEDPHLAVNAGVSGARFQGSAGLREQMWDRGGELFTTDPLGVGPHGIASRNLLGRGAEIHSDYLATVVERGFIGAAGLALFVLVLWRSSKKGGAFRTLLVAASVAAIFRETLHFRHLWLFLAIALAWDDRKAGGRAESDAAAA